MGEAALTEVFRRHSSVNVTEEELRRLVRRGEEAWPQIASNPEAFIAHVARHVNTQEALAKIHASDLYLAWGILQRDRAALQAFEDQFMARVPEYIVRVRAGREFVDEVQQKLRELLILGSEGGHPKLADYAGKGPLGGWLRVTASRTALNALRAEEAPKEELGEMKAVAGDPELAYVREHAKAIFQQAFEKILQDLDPQGRTILKLHYIDGLTMDQLAHLYKTPRSTIARRVTEARQNVLKATETLLHAEKRLSPSAVASVIRQGAVQFELTLTRLLR